ncbi:hypothetical protein KAM479c_26310 (plasmid) [Aeromonas caviae]|nr:hypothetical protein KAM479c_26310 [Aeromonas caviae]
MFTISPWDLWGNGNRVEYAQITNGRYTISQSLYLVQVEELELYHTDDGKRKAAFIYNDIHYELAVTDPMFDEIVTEDRDIQGILCVSLGEEYLGYCYKLVAAIF